MNIMKNISLLCLFILLPLTSLIAQEAKPLWVNANSWFDYDGTSLQCVQDGGVHSVDPLTGQAAATTGEFGQSALSRYFNPSLMYANIERPADLIGLKLLFRGIFGDFTFYGLYQAGMIMSPGKEYFGKPSDKGITILDARGGMQIREIAKPASGRTEWRFINKDWLLRIQDDKASLFAVSTGAETPINLDAPLRVDCIFIRPNAFYLFTSKSLYKFDSATATLAWTSSALPISPGGLQIIVASCLYEGKSGLFVGLSSLNLMQKWCENTKFYLINQANGELLSGPIASRAYFPLERESLNNEIVNNVTESTNGTFLVDCINFSVIDTQLQKEVWAGSRHKSFNVDFAAMELRQDRLFRKYFPLALLSDPEVVLFDANGSVRVVDYRERKNGLTFKLGVPLVTTKKFGDATWIIGADFRNIALRAIDSTTFADQGYKLKPTRVYGWDLNDQGLYYCENSTIHRISPSFEESKVSLANELGKKEIETINVAADGKTAWLSTETTIAQFDFQTGNIIAQIKWKPSDFKFKDAEARNSVIIWQRGNSLFVTRSLLSTEETVPLQAYDLTSGKLAWATQTMPRPFAFVDSAKVIVVGTKKGCAAFSYPAP